MIPSIGRIVILKISKRYAESINHSRSNLSLFNKGNPVIEGDEFPMIITKLWADRPTEDSAISGQVFLDGNDLYWVSSVRQGNENGQWHDPRGG